MSSSCAIAYIISDAADDGGPMGFFSSKKGGVQKGAPGGSAPDVPPQTDRGSDRSLNVGADDGDSTKRSFSNVPGTASKKVEDTYAQWRSLAGVKEALFCPATEREKHPIGVLELEVIEGFGLPAADFPFAMASDPYCIATLTGQAIPIATVQDDLQQQLCACRKPPPGVWPHASFARHFVWARVFLTAFLSAHGGAH